MNKIIYQVIEKETSKDVTCEILIDGYGDFFKHFKTESGCGYTELDPYCDDYHVRYGFKWQSINVYDGDIFKISLMNYVVRFDPIHGFSLVHDDDQLDISYIFKYVNTVKLIRKQD